MIPPVRAAQSGARRGAGRFAAVAARAMPRRADARAPAPPPRRSACRSAQRRSISCVIRRYGFRGFRKIQRVIGPDDIGVPLPPPPSRCAGVPRSASFSASATSAARVSGPVAASAPDPQPSLRIVARVASGCVGAVQASIIRSISSSSTNAPCTRRGLMLSELMYSISPRPSSFSAPVWSIITRASVCEVVANAIPSGEVGLDQAQSPHRPKGAAWRRPDECPSPAPAAPDAPAAVRLRRERPSSYRPAHPALPPNRAAAARRRGRRYRRRCCARLTSQSRR